MAKKIDVPTLIEVVVQYHTNDVQVVEVEKPHGLTYSAMKNMGFFYADMNKKIISLLKRNGVGSRKSAKISIKTDSKRLRFMSLVSTPTNNKKTNTSSQVGDEPSDKTTNSVNNDIQLIRSTLNTSTEPTNIIINPVKWKYLIRTILRGKNLLVVGDTGCGKTSLIKAAAQSLDRPFFEFPLGSTQDPRSSLIGNTHFNKEDGTYFAESMFVKAIQTPNAIILLDEISRAHPEAWNILMSVLDETQRYLRIDESPNTPVIKVADGVSFLSTANIGAKFTSTRILDRALRDRFQVLEMDILNEEQQVSLLKMKCPDLTDIHAKILGAIYADLATNCETDNAKIADPVSTRTIIEAAKLIEDGFDIRSACEITIFPQYSRTGGLDSERTYVKQLVQKHIPDDKLNDPNIFVTATGR